MEKNGLSIIIDIFIWVFLIGFAIIILTPLLFMFTASIMPAEEIMKVPYPWISSTFHWQNFWKALKGNDGKFLFVRTIINSFIVASLTTLGTIFLSSMAGYGLAKFRFKGRMLVLMLILSTMMIPFEAIMIPLYLIVTKMGLQDSYAGLIVPLLLNAFGIFMMRQYLITFPEELLDAARIDGATEFGIFWKIIFPNSLPAITTLAILTFRSQWDNLIWPLLVVQTPEKKTIPLFIIQFASEKYTDEGALMAAAAIASIPMLILFFKLSKYFLSGAELFAARKD